MGPMMRRVDGAMAASLGLAGVEGIYDEGARFERPKGCGCGHIACVCDKVKGHAAACRYAIALRSPVGIECPHARDVCGLCDPCTCAGTSAGAP
jgi:hypothetical protein